MQTIEFSLKPRSCDLISVYLESASLCRPVFSEGNQLLIQFLSDLSLTADGFIGHYKFRPKKFPTTTILPTTTTQPGTTRPIRR